MTDSSAVASSRALVERELGGRLVGRLECGCYVYDAGGVVVVGDACDLDHYDAANDLVELARAGGTA
jgi:hypothetical protein